MKTEQSKFDLYWKHTRGSYILFGFIMAFVFFALFRALNNDKQSEYYNVAVEYVSHAKEIVDVTGEITSIGYFVGSQTLEPPYWVKLKVVGKNRSLEVQVFLLNKETGWIADSHKVIN